MSSTDEYSTIASTLADRRSAAVLVRTRSRYASLARKIAVRGSKCPVGKGRCGGSHGSCASETIRASLRSTSSPCEEAVSGLSPLSTECRFSASAGGSGPETERWNGASPFDCCPSRGCQRLRDHSSRQASSFRRTMIKTPLETLRCGWWHHPLPASPASSKKWQDPHLCFATPSPRSGQRVGAARRPRVAARARMRKSPVSPANLSSPRPFFHRRCGADSTNRPILCPSDTGPRSSPGRGCASFRHDPERAAERVPAHCYTVRLACRKVRRACTQTRRRSAAHGNSGETAITCRTGR